MLNKILISIMAVGFLAACEPVDMSGKVTTASSDDSSTSTSSSGSSTTSSDVSTSSNNGGTTATAEVVEVVTLSVEEELASVGNSVYFGYDSAVLSSDSKAVLASQAIILAANPEVTIVVEGHCDERGTREYNLALGERRAASARDYLISQGVSAARIKTISYGKERPAFVGSTSYAYSKNRRATSVIQ